MPQVYSEVCELTRKQEQAVEMENWVGVLKRFWSKVNKGRLDECWEWFGANDGRYGQFWFRNRKYRANRASWIIHNGEIPDGIWVLHKCDNPPCINPNHLFLGTRSENMLDAGRKGRLSNNRTKMSHCPNGHKYIPSNTYIRATGIRNCKKCNQKRQRGKHE